MGCQASSQMPRVLDQGIELNGAVTPLYSASVHYWRLDPELWPHILDRVKDLGFPFVCTYIPWVVHELDRGRSCLAGITAASRDETGRARRAVPLRERLCWSRTGRRRWGGRVGSGTRHPPNQGVGRQMTRTRRRASLQG